MISSTLRLSYLLHYSSTFIYILFFFFNDTATTEIYTLSLHDALPIWPHDPGHRPPTLDHRACRPRGGDGARPHCRAGNACRAAGAGRPVRPIEQESHNLSWTEIGRASCRERV